MDCGKGKYLQGFGKLGKLNCFALPSSTAVLPAPTPASVVNLPPLDLNCGAGKYLQGIDSAGNKICVAIPSNPNPVHNPVVTAPISPLQPATPVWNLDKHCSGQHPNCGACQTFTTSTCPANPGGLMCSAQEKLSYCVTPQECRRYKCY